MVEHYSSILLNGLFRIHNIKASSIPLMLALLYVTSHGALCNLHLYVCSHHILSLVHVCIQYWQSHGLQGI